VFMRYKNQTIFNSSQCQSDNTCLYLTFFERNKVHLSFFSVRSKYIFFDLCILIILYCRYNNGNFVYTQECANLCFCQQCVISYIRRYRHSNILGGVVNHIAIGKIGTNLRIINILFEQAKPIVIVNELKGQFFKLILLQDVS